MTTILRNCGWIYSCDENDLVVANGYIRVEGEMIVEIGREPYAGPDGETIDLSGSIVLPGFVNVHHHFFQSLTKAVPPGTRARGLDWLYQMYPIWACFDVEAFAISSELAAAELLLSGATTSVDHSYLHPGLGNESLAAQVDAAARIGLRLHLVRSAIPTIEGDLEFRLEAVMGPAIHDLMDDPAGIMPAFQQAIQRYHDLSEGSMLRIAIGPTGVTYAQPELMAKMARLASEANCGLHTHYHPRKTERDFARRVLGCEPLKFMTDSGWIRPGTWLAHATQLDNQEIAALSAAGVGIAHCPHTVVRLGYPITPVAKMRRSGVVVGIGMDGPASNDRSFDDLGNAPRAATSPRQQPR